MSAQTGFFRIRFRADPVELAFFRAGLNRWLLDLQWPEADRVDAVLAINEVCDQGVRQAWVRGGVAEMEVSARLVIGADDRRIVAVVCDDVRAPIADDPDGLWLAMVGACMHRVQVRHRGDGTRVTMTSRPVPLAGGEVDDGGPDG